MRRQFPNNKSCDWIEIYQCPNPEMNGEMTFAQAIEYLFKIDFVIDVGAADSYLPKVFRDIRKMTLFDTRQLTHRHDYVRNVPKLVGTGEDQVRLKDFHEEDFIHFYKIDTDGYDWDAIQTIDEDHFIDIPFLQFEYDFHWDEKRASIKDCIEHLKRFYKNFYYIHFNKLIEADLDGLTKCHFDQIGYKNIVCTNHDNFYINREMHRLHPNLDGAYYRKLKRIAQQDLEKYNTAKRRGSNKPHWTFKEN